jgi:hypothetical protein
MEIQKALLRSSGSFFTWSRTQPPTSIVACAVFLVVPFTDALLTYLLRAIRFWRRHHRRFNSTYEQVFCLNEKQRFQFELGTNKIRNLGRHLPSLGDCCAHAAGHLGNTFWPRPGSYRELVKKDQLYIFPADLPISGADKTAIGGQRVESPFKYSFKTETMAPRRKIECMSGLGRDPGTGSSGRCAASP